MSDNAKQAWNDVGERFSSWGRRVAGRYRESGGESGTGESAQEAQRKLEEAARQIGDQLNRAFTALGDTMRDDEAKSELKEAVRALGDAVTATVTKTGDAIRRRVSSKDVDGPTPPTPDDAPGDDAGAA
jgi:hypothetical protein